MYRCFLVENVERAAQEQFLTLRKTELEYQTQRYFSDVANYCP